MLRFILIVLTTLNVSCANSFKKKTLIGMATGFTAGYIIGSSSAPEGESKQMHGALYGSAASALVGAGMIYFFDESRELKQRKRIQQMTATIDELKKKKTSVGTGLMIPGDSNLPKDLKNLIRPGHWKLYEVDYWVKKGNTLIHQDKELNFEPSQLK